MPADTPRPDPTPATRPRQTAAPVTGEKFGKFLRTDRLGAGGMGEVWKAWDTELSRWVALKFLKGEDPEEVARFKREAAIAGKLSHPNIGAIYDVGEAGGRHYIAMQFVNGKTLRGWKGKPREAAEMIRDAAAAVHAAHLRGIVHRDLKPDNLMRDLDHRLFVMDFGLARPAEGAAKLSVSGTVVGTPAYMPPEQARGERVDPRADVYSLGATLYELLAGSAPFRGESVLEVLLKVAEDDAVPLRKLKPGIDSDLDTIAMKCLEKDRERRYATAEELAADLTRWIDGEPITAHPPSVLYRLRKRLAKRKALVAAGALGFVAVGVALGLLVPALQRERAAKARVERVAGLWSRVSVILAEAEAASRAGERKLAVQRCDDGVAACAESAGVAETHYFLARFHRTAGRTAEARRELDRALALDPTFGEAHFERGLMLVDEYQRHVYRHLYGGGVPPSSGDGRSLVQRMEQVHPEMKALREAAMADLSVTIGRSAYFREADAAYGRAELEALSGGFAKNVEIMERVVAADPLNVRALCALARDAASDNQLQKARDLATRAIEIHRGFGEAYYLRGQVYYNAQEDLDDAELRQSYKESARKDLDRAVLHGFGTPEAFVVRAQVRRDLGDLDGCIEDATEALRQHPTFVLAYLFRAAATEDKGDPRAALDDYDRGAAIDPRNPALLSYRSDAKKTLGDFDGAYADLTEATRANPRHYQAWLKRGVLNRERKRYTEALTDLAKAAEIKPWRAEALAERAGTLQDLGRIEEAIAEATRAIEAEKGSYRGWYQRGMARGQAGRIDEAAADLEQSLKLEPRHSAGWGGLGNCRAAKGDYAGALAAYGEAVKLNPRSVNALMNRAVAHTRRGDWTAAVADYDLALAVEPENLLLLLRRGDARINTGDKAGAAADLSKALRLAPPDWASRKAAEALLKKARD
jgi:tetratricopeptide (TPR) repeat protein